MFELDSRLENDTVTLGELNLCRILLMNDSQYPWLILVPQVEDITEIHQLSNQQRQVLAEESNLVAELLTRHFSADKMNIAALGNVVSQLHIHHVVRFKKDMAWPAPVWGMHPVKLYDGDELQVLVKNLQSLFKPIDIFTAK